MGLGVLGVGSSKPAFLPWLYTDVPRLFQLLPDILAVPRPFLWEPLGMDRDITLDGDLQEPQVLCLDAGSEKYWFRG